MNRLKYLTASLGLGLLAWATPARTQETIQSSPNLEIDTEPADPMGQVTSVSQLSDVRSSDWAFQAVQALVERYGVISGYPDGTFRGNRPLSRYEFAAAIAQVIGRIEEQVLSGNIGGTAQQDMLTIRRLINSYGTALDHLRKRLDSLSTRITTQERQQFSATTKLHGRTDFSVTNRTDDGLTLINRVRLNLLTSLQGSDRLVTELEMGNDGEDAIAKAHSQPQNLLGTTGVLADGGGIDAVGAPQQVRVRKLYYAFRPSESVEVAVGPNLPPSDFVDHNSYTNPSGHNFSSSFFLNNPLIVQNEIDRFGGGGAAVTWDVQPNLTLRVLYAAADSANPGNGLFSDRYQATVEAEYRYRPITVRVQYTRAEINGTKISAGGINAEWTTQRRFGVFGVFARLGFGSYEGFNTVLQQDLDLNPTTWTVGASIQNFLIPGSRAGIAIGQPFVTRKLGNATQANLEAFFGLALNDHISISPSLMVVSNPNNRTSPTIWQWSLRLLYAF